jgi:phosphoribosyl-ATP pyrophosphohydrolase
MAPFTVHDLAENVRRRADASPEVSYTRQLLDRGVVQCAKKLGEEAIEAVLAAVSEDREHLIAEAADVIYHLLVVLQARGVSLADVEAELERRSLQSGIAEKAARRGT